VTDTLEKAVAELDRVTDQAIRAERRWASRKWIMVLAFFLVASLFLHAGKVTDALWIDLVKWLTGLYMVGNVGALAAQGWNAQRK
jgi:hypothetical protein